MSVTSLLSGGSISRLECDIRASRVSTPAERQLWITSDRKKRSGAKKILGINAGLNFTEKDTVHSLAERTKQPSIERALNKFMKEY